METTPESSKRRTRSDATRNRQLILTTAERLFAKSGPSTSMTDVAREAGVGIGTVYRHFPDKDSIIVAMAEARVEDIGAQTEKYLLMEDPRQALRSHMIELLQVSAENRILFEIYESMRDVSERYRLSAEKARENIQELIRRAQRTGAVAPDFRWEDVRILLRMTEVMARSDSGLSKERTRRWIHTLVDGIVFGDDEQA